MATHEITLEVDKTGQAIPQVLVMRVGDTDETIKALVRSSGMDVALDGCEARFLAEKPDRTYADMFAQVSGSTATVKLAPEFLAVAGNIKTAYFRFERDGDVFTTQNVWITVIPDAYSAAGGLSDDYVEAIDEMVEMLQELKASMEEAEAGRVEAEGDRAEAEAGRVTAELSRVQAESDRVKAESKRANAEGDRQSAEAARSSSEKGRVGAENARVSAESSRASAESSRAQAEESRSSAERLRALAESNRESAEDERAEAEAARGSAETQRAAAEDNRDEAEAARVAAESVRVSNENARKTAEAARAEAESERKSAESSRSSAESARASAESARASAEASRVSAEQGREQDQAKNNADQALNNAAMQKLSPYICAAGEYDPDTLMPTIQGEAGRMYYVPSSQGPGNNYVEWMLIGGSWEMMGVTQVEVTNISTAQIDQVAAGNAPQGEDVLSLTGLSYLWAKVKGAFAALSHKHSAADITSGALPLSRGGTGKTTAKGAQNAILGTMNQITTDGSDSSNFVVAYDSPTDTNGAVCKRPALNVWNWIKAKCDALYAKASHTHAATQVTGLTANRALVSNGSGQPAASVVTSAELGYLDGVTSNVQAQLNGKAASSHSHSYLPLAGGTMNGPIHFNSNALAGTGTGEYVCCIDAFDDGGEMKYIGAGSLRSAIGAAASSHTHSAATTSAAGFMSAADKTKLNGIATGANKTTVDSALSSTSANPVQNKVINSALAGKAASSHNHSAANITSGTLAVARGGTGVTANPSMLVNLASGSAAGVFASAPRPGVTGTLPVSKGGTGATSASAARSALGVSPKGVVLYNNSTGTTGDVTLSQSAANFNMLLICYRTNDNYCGSTVVYSPNGKKVALHVGFSVLSSTGSKGTYLKTKAYNISGTKMQSSIDDDPYGYGAVFADGTQAQAISASYIYVTQVIGFNL